MKLHLWVGCLLLLSTGNAYAVLQKPILGSPADNAVNQSTTQKFQATSNYGSAKYQFEYAKNPQFNSSVRVWSYDGGNVGFGYSLPLEFNTLYYWRTRIFTSSDSSDWSAVRSFTTDTAIYLLGPSDNSGPTSPGIYFSLARNAHYNGYLLECDTVKDFSSAGLCRQYIQDTFTWFYIETREPCIRFKTRYYWRLRGFNQTDTSAWTGIRTFITSDTVRIYNPATTLTNASTSVKFEFGMDRFLSHQIQYDTLANFSSANNIFDIPRDFQDYIYLRWLNFDQTYHWRVRSCATTDTSKWSTPRMINTYGYKNRIGISTSNNPIPPENVFTFGMIDSASAYQVQAAFNSGFNDPLFLDTTVYFDPKKTFGQNSSIYIIGIPFNKTMFLRIRPIHARDTGEWSNTFSRNTLTQATSYYPFNNSSNVPVDTLFSFKGYAGIDRYRVQRDLVSTFNSPALVDTVYVWGNTSHLPKMNYNTRYYWRVSYIRNSDTSAWSPAATFTTQVVPVLRSPLQLHLSSPGVQALLDWDSMPGTEQFEIMLDTSSDFSSPVVQIFKQDAKNSYLEVKELFFGKYYYWKVRAMHPFDTSNWSETWFFTTYAGPTLDWPKNNQTNISFSSLDWRSINGTEGYEYYLSTDSLFTQSWTGKESKKNSFFHYFTPNPTQFNTRYFWKVRVFHARDTSEWSEVWNFTTRPRSGVNLTYPANKQTKIPPGLTLTWEAVSNATQYVVQWSESPDMSAPTFSNASAQLAVSLKVNQTYYWNVIAKNKDGIHVSDTSETFSFTTDSSFSAPNLLSPADKLTQVPVNGVGFSWTSVAGASYDIQFGLDPAFVNQQTQSTTQNSLSISAFQNGKTYYWRVRAKNSWSTGPWSATRSFQTVNGLSVPSAEGSSSMVYPNPAKEVIHFHVNPGEEWQYRILAENGQVVSAGTTLTGRIDVQGLASGLYRLMLTSGHEQRNILFQKTGNN